MDLKDLRGEIDRIDDQLVRLFAARMDAVRQVAAAKQQTGRPIFDRARERDILDRLSEQAGESCAPYVRALYSRVFELSRSCQASLGACAGPLAEALARAASGAQGARLPDRAAVACPGAEGSAGGRACAKLFARPDVRYFDRIDDVLRALEEGDCRYGMLPVGGAWPFPRVGELLAAHGFQIVGAAQVPEECKGGCARFICVARGAEVYPGARRVSLMLDLSDESASLSQVLEKLAVAGIDILALEGSPLPERGFRCFIDIDADVADPAAVRLLCELEACADRLAFLGCYGEAN